MFGASRRMTFLAMTAVAVVALALPLVGCNTIQVTLPSGKVVQAVADLDPYAKRYYFYYDDPVTGRRKRVPQEWFEQPVTAPESEAEALQASSLPGGLCPGAPAGSEARKRDFDPSVVLNMIRDCYSGNGSSLRD